MEIDGGGDVYVTIKAAKLTDKQLDCLSTMERQAPYAIFFFENLHARQRYYDLQEVRGRFEARDWLEQRGLLARLPSYNPDEESLKRFARRLESLCTIEPGSMLTLYKNRMLTIRPEWAENALENPESDSKDEKFTCLRNAISASNLHQYDVGFGFIGNEAYSSEVPTK